MILVPGFGTPVGDVRGEMTAIRFPLLECPHCGCPIRLPHPNPQEKSPDQSAWPTDAWNRIFGCLICGRVWRGTGADVKWGTSQSVGRGRLATGERAVEPSVLYEAAKCGAERPGTLVHIHNSWYAMPTPSEAAQIEAKWKPRLEEIYGAPVVFSGFHNDPDWWKS